MMQPVINYFAVVAAAISYMVIGMLWYGPLFGKQWMALMGFSKKSMKGMKLSMQQAMIGGAISALVMSYVLAHFVHYLEVTTLAGAFLAAFWIWLGFTATVQIGAVLWDNKPWKLYVLNTLHSLVALIVMASILALWP